MIIIGERQDIQHHDKRYMNLISEERCNDESIWEAFWFTDWHESFVNEKKRLILNGADWLNHLYKNERGESTKDKKYDLIIIQDAPLSDLHITLDKYSRLMKPGKYMLLTVRLEGERVVERLCGSIPLDRLRPYNGYYNRLIYKNDNENLCIAGLCLTRLFFYQDIEDKAYELKSNNEEFMIRKMNIPKAHFLYSIYPEAQQRLYFPEELRHRNVSVESLKNIYNCSKEDALSLWNDLYDMKSLKNQSRIKD